jgi:DivIVA domain-containing protein
VNLLQILLVLAVVAGVGAVATGAVRGGLEAPESTLPQSPLPAGPLAADDLRDVRFSLALRGYRMQEVDEVLDRLTSELAARDLALAEAEARTAEQEAQIAHLRGRPLGLVPDQD